MGTKESGRGKSEQASVHPLAPGQPRISSTYRARVVLLAQQPVRIGDGHGVVYTKLFGACFDDVTCEGCGHQDGTQPRPSPTCIGAIRETKLCSCVVLRGCRVLDEPCRCSSTDVNIARNRHSQNFSEIQLQYGTVLGHMTATPLQVPRFPFCSYGMQILTLGESVDGTDRIGHIGELVFLSACSVG
jgi:hypothetical protein